VEVEFSVLDATYEVAGREPVVVLWAKLRDGSTAALLDRRFRPYFYVLPSPTLGETSLQRLAAKILALSNPRSPIVSVEPVERKYFGRPIKVLKVTTVVPEFVRDYREKVRELPEVEDVLEADIRFAFRYMIDKDVKPFRWYAAKVEEVQRPDFRAQHVFALKEDPVEVEEKGLRPPELSVVAFDIEVLNPAGSPRPEKDPVIIIGLASSSKRWQLVAEDGDDKKILQELVEAIREADPDVIVGYNSNRFDWPYLVERSKVKGVKLDVGRKVGSEPTPSVHGHVSIAGRLNVDLYDFAEEIPEVKMKTLDEVCEHLGVMKRSERELVEWYEIPELWSSPEKRKRLLKYNMDDVVSTLLLSEKFLPFGVQLSSLTGVPLDQVMAASVGFRLEFYLMRRAYKHGELVPNRVERRAETYKGAVVLKPKPGTHENIVVLDFTSMYPNIMIKYNVGPDTLVRNGAGSEDAYVAPDVGHKFRKEPPGFFKSVLQALLEARKKIREELKKLPKGSPEYQVLDERQKAIKVLANAAYGYMGWQAARWYCKECAEAVTAWGRYNILTAIRKAKELGLEVIYGDTDSLFVRNDPDKLRAFIEWVESELGFEIKVDKVYKRVFFTEAKKRYVGLTEDGTTDVVGFEAVRGDWAEVAKETQFEVARIVLEEGSVEKAVEYVRKLVSELKQKKVPYEKLIIWKTLSKRLEEYEVDAPHVVAAKMYIEAGLKAGVGDKIGYVVTKGSGKVSDRVRPYFQATIDDIDVDYYVDHQIVPAALRILGYFGVSEAALKATAAKGQKTLFDFFSQASGKRS